MRSRTSSWFETKVRYEKMMDDGQQKPVTEQYVVDALSFTEAEAKIMDEMSVYVSGEMKIKDIKPAAYGEIFFSDLDGDDRWYKAKLQFITIDEKTEKEKRSNVTYLVQASSVPVAVKHIDEVMGKTMIDYVIAGINETPIMDVFEHENKSKAEQEQHDDKPEYEQAEAPKAE
ncbi:MAG: DUF4494 domain-containing protein [Prevotellaceae bacterium]|uniref:DUF4494 domain-containing protein n=1 Tax=Prevotella sp. AGR2160 TaxID=1280674 RepID=UPI00041D120C|nr:DUF4494 domain-containing protein [Prevotella sp. AGR2160]MDD5861492.1 DUF4494 domain-containing protein [Prevotella sp.]MDD6553176.1 DUF4494 domain-containing protein [Prevotellaceae bacterium]